MVAVAAPAGLAAKALQRSTVASAVPSAAPSAAPAAAPAARLIYTDNLVEEKFEGRGKGRKTLAMLADEIGFDLARAKQKLAARNVRMKDDESLKDVATKTGMAPMEILKIILVGEPVKA